MNLLNQISRNKRWCRFQWKSIDSCFDRYDSHCIQSNTHTQYSTSIIWSYPAVSDLYVWSNVNVHHMNCLCLALYAIVVFHLNHLNQMLMLLILLLSNRKQFLFSTLSFGFYLSFVTVDLFGCIFVANV